MLLEWLTSRLSTLRSHEFVEDQLRDEVGRVGVVLVAEADDFTHWLSLPAREIAPDVRRLEEGGHKVFTRLHSLHLLLVVLFDFFVPDLR